MDTIRLKPSVERTLRLIAERPAKVNDLVQPGLSPATLFRHTATLRELGLAISDAEGVYRLTARGRDWLDASTAGIEVTPELPIPALGLAPSPVHRSVLVIGLCAAAGRVHAVADRSLAGLVLVGASGGFKSTVAEALVCLAGGDREKDLVDASVEAAKGLLVRRDARGEEVTRSHLLEVPVAVFDEVEKLDDAKAKNVLENLYFAGTATVTSGGQVLAMKCTPVAVMNPVDDGAAAFEDLTGFHSSRERRVVLVQVPRVKLGAAQVDQDWLQELIALDSARAPKLSAPRSPTLRAAGRFRTIIDLVISDPQVAEHMDPHVLNNLARGATAWLDDERAVRLVAFNWARLAATTGRCHADWELRLGLHFSPREVLKTHRARKRARRMKRLYDLVKEHLDGDLALAREVIKREGVLRREAPELPAKTASIVTTIMADLDGDFAHALSLLRLDLELKRRGLKSKAAADLARFAQDRELSDDVARRSLKLGAALMKHGLSRKTAYDLASLAHELQLAPTDARYCLELGFELARRGFRFEDLPSFDRHFSRP